MIAAEPNRVQLANLPTPLLRLERLSNAYPGSQIWLKRDDLSGMELSGNKVRKLEYIAAAALHDHCTTIVTEGAPQSNHCRATAAICAKLGLHCHLLFRPAPPTELLGNHLLDALFGATWSGYEVEDYRRRRDEIIGAELDKLRDAGQTPRFTPAGASEPLGCWGYIRAAAELAAQLQAVGVHRCDLVAACSSDGTAAGLVLGKLLHHLDHVRLWFVPVSDDVAFHQRAIADLCTTTIQEFALPTSYSATDVHFWGGYVGAGYAVPTPVGLDALRVAARIEGVMFDPVYTGKAFAALLDAVRERRLGFDRPVVFLHTGGAFSNFAWPQLLVPQKVDLHG